MKRSAVEVYMAHDLSSTRDRLAGLLDQLTSATHPKDHVVVSSPLDRAGREIVRFDVVCHSSDGTPLIYRTEIELDTFRQ